MKLEDFTTLIEATIEALGVNPKEARCSEDGQWILYRDDIEIYVDIWEQKDHTPWVYFRPEEPLFVFQVIAPVCYLPSSNHEKFFEELLLNNLNMFYGSFTINKDENMLAVKYRRIGHGLKQEDIVEAIESVGYYAETTFKALNDRYQVMRVDFSD